MTIYGQPIETDRPKHPSSSWANWKNGKFMVWDKNAKNPETPDKEGAEVEIKLPDEFVVIAECWSIKGYLESKGGVWSNEIDSFSKDIFTVRSNNGEILYEGKWADIKDQVKSVGLGLTKNVHYVDPKHPDELKTFCIKGAALKEWMEQFTNENRNVPANNTLTLKEVKDGKKGSVKYSFPSFAAANPLSQEERVLQQQWGAKLVVYREATAITEEELKDEMAEKAAVKYDDDNLPF